METKHDWRYGVGYLVSKVPPIDPGDEERRVYTPFQVRVDWVRPGTSIQYLWDEETSWVDTPFQGNQFNTMEMAVEGIKHWILGHG